jgi:hypothetical protein
MEAKSFGGLKSLQTIRHYPCAITEGSSGMPLIRGRLYPPVRDSGKISLNPLRKFCLSFKSVHSTAQWGSFRRPGAVLHRIAESFDRWRPFVEETPARIEFRDSKMR